MLGNNGSASFTFISYDFRLLPAVSISLGKPTWFLADKDRTPLNKVWSISGGWLWFRFNIDYRVDANTKASDKVVEETLNEYEQSKELE